LKGIFPAIMFFCVLAVNMGLAWDGLPEGPRRELVYERCRACHGLSRIMERGRARQAWKKVINRMSGLGLEANEKEKGIILDYLATHRGASPAK